MQRSPHAESQPTAALDSPVGAEITAHQRSVPSLDGLRAVSIALVVISHYGPLVFRSAAWAAYFFQLGQLGVDTFFVISGFLITFLLCKEHAERLTISLKRFYIRRAFRIFPAFYIFLALAALVTATGKFPLHARDFAIAGFYLSNYLLPRGSNVLEHTWSLALEEQFYLFWPLCLLLLKPARAWKLALALLVIEPFVRVALYVLFPDMRGSGRLSSMFHTRIDTIMFGCLIALLWRTKKFQTGFIRRHVRVATFLCCLVFLFSVEPLLNIYYRSLYHAFWFTLEGAALSFCLIYLVHYPFSFVGQVLNVPAVRFIGVLSYSLYLWQQMFIDFWPGRHVLNLSCAFAAALLSYYLVERPSLRLRDKWLHRPQYMHTVPTAMPPASSH